MRYQTKYKSNDGVIKTDLVDGLSWSDVVNRLITLSDVVEVVSVRSLASIPLTETVKAKLPKRSAWDRMTNA